MYVCAYVCVCVCAGCMLLLLLLQLWVSPLYYLQLHVHAVTDYIVYSHMMHSLI